MKRALIKSSLVLILLSVVFIPIRATGQPATFIVHSDRNLTQPNAYCPSGPVGTVIDTLYLAAMGFTEPIEGVEFQLEFPPEITYLADLSEGNWSQLRIGNSSQGISIVFLAPVDAYNPIILLEILILWMCDGCDVAYDAPIVVRPHPDTGSLRAVTSNLEFEDAVGYTSYVCPSMCKGCKHDAVAVTTGRAPAVPVSQQCVLDCPAGDGGVILPGELPEEHHSPDLNDDGVVDIQDFALFAVEYPWLYDPEKDFYCSGNIDLRDFVLYGRHWLHEAPIPVEESTWGGIKAMYRE